MRMRRLTILYLGQPLDGASVDSVVDDVAYNDSVCLPWRLPSELNERRALKRPLQVLWR